MNRFRILVQNLIKNHQRKLQIFGGFAVLSTSLSLYFFHPKVKSILARGIQPSKPLIYELEQNEKKKIRNPGELRFAKFSSLELDGEPLMTPKDFLDSLIFDRPRKKYHPKEIDEKEAKKLLRNTPAIDRFVSIHKSQDPKLFRQIGTKGIISYPEYLFLLSILSKPKCGIRVAFDLIDISYENHIVKDEYEKFVIFAAKAQKKNFDPEKANFLINDTTLATHFFGLDGKHKLTFDEFSAFIEGLQREVLKAEFFEYSLGMETITENDFARILLRYVDISEREQNNYFDLLESRLPPEEERPGLQYFQVEQFFILLTNIADFSFAFRLFGRAGRPLSKPEFARAAKICMKGEELDPYVIDVLFAMFDKANDNCLSYDEFFVVMKNRLNRQVRRSFYLKGWDAFKQCVREERIKRSFRPI